MVTGQTTTVGTETSIEEEKAAAIEEITGEVISKGIIMAIMEVDIEEEATLAVAGVAEDKEEAELVIYNSITNVLRKEIILKETKPCRETTMGIVTPTALIIKSSSLKYLLIPLIRSRKISTW